MGGYQQLLLIKTNSQGSLSWRKKFGNGNHVEYCGQQTYDDGYIISGSHAQVPDINIYLVKTDVNGNITSTFNIPTINTSKGELLKIIDILGRETKGKTNEPLFYIYDDGTVEKRITIE